MSKTIWILAIAATFVVGMLVTADEVYAPGGGGGGGSGGGSGGGPGSSSEELGFYTLTSNINIVANESTVQRTLTCDSGDKAISWFGIIEVVLSGFPNLILRDISQPNDGEFSFFYESEDGTAYSSSIAITGKSINIVCADFNPPHV